MMSSVDFIVQVPFQCDREEKLQTLSFFHFVCVLFAYSIMYPGPWNVNVLSIVMDY